MEILSDFDLAFPLFVLIACVPIDFFPIVFAPIGFVLIGFVPIVFERY
jgi:hypothetical protein